MPTEGATMNRREFMKTAVATAAGVSMGGIVAVNGKPPVMDWIQYTAFPPIKEGVMVYIAADGKARED